MEWPTRPLAEHRNLLDRYLRWLAEAIGGIEACAGHPPQRQWPCHPRTRNGQIELLLRFRRIDNRRSAPTLNPAATRRDSEGLAEWMRVPGSSRARLKSNAGALKQRGVGGLK